MCNISRISQDWIQKGCHIHVGRAELSIRPGENGGIVMKRVFSSTPAHEIEKAIKIAEAWLDDAQERQRLIRTVERARAHFGKADFGAIMTPKARAKSGELHFLLAALRKKGA